jgi:beta-aspartyl-peptidase (threonine type)
MTNFGIAVHGGAGTILKSELPIEKEKEYHVALKEAIQRAYSILGKGGSALVAVEEAVIFLEDCELFNAGKGSVFTSAGTHEMDASIMDGKSLQAGAVSLIKHIKNPITLARLILEKSDHILLASDGAEEFAFANGLEKVSPDYFYNESRYQQWLSVKDSDISVLDHSVIKEKKLGTVGAVALDCNGNLAAATSTGGMTNKKFGRIGDTPLIGSGTYADNLTAAVSCTGSGEYFIRINAAFNLVSLMKYGKLNLVQAGDEVILNQLSAIGGDGGLISINSQGEIYMPFNTEGMYRGFCNSKSGKPSTFIYR